MSSMWTNKMKVNKSWWQYIWLRVEGNICLGKYNLKFIHFSKHNMLLRNLYSVQYYLKSWVYINNTSSVKNKIFSFAKIKCTLRELLQITGLCKLDWYIFLGCIYKTLCKLERLEELEEWVDSSNMRLVVVGWL